MTILSKSKALTTLDMAFQGIGEVNDCQFDWIMYDSPKKSASCTPLKDGGGKRASPEKAAAVRAAVSRNKNGNNNRDGQAVSFGF